EAFDNRYGAGIAYRKTFAGNAPEIGLTLDSAVKHGIADDNGVFRRVTGRFRRSDSDASSRQALADIVVGIANEIDRDTPREKCTQTLASRAGQLDRYRILRKSLMTVSSGNFA